MIRGICINAHVLLLSLATGVSPHGGFRALVSNINHLYTFHLTLHRSFKLLINLGQMHERSCSSSAPNHIISPHRHLPYQQWSWDYQKYHEFIFAVIIYYYTYHGQRMNAHVLLCSMVYQPHSFPPPISS